jgi:RNA polymerase sigma-70 factor (ECF subfamily)
LRKSFSAVELRNKTCSAGKSMESPADELLIGRIARGDRMAIQVLFARHHVTIYRFLLRLLQDEMAAEDIESEVFLDVWRQAGRFEGRSTVLTWLISIARFKALTQLRRRTADEAEDQPEAHSYEEAAVTNEFEPRQEILRRCLARLSPAHREIIELAFYHDKSAEEAAEILAIPVSAVKTRMYYARQRIQEGLDAEGFEVGPSQDAQPVSELAETMGMSLSVMRSQIASAALEGRSAGMRAEMRFSAGEGRKEHSDEPEEKELSAIDRRSQLTLAEMAVQLRTGRRRRSLREANEGKEFGDADRPLETGRVRDLPETGGRSGDGVEVSAFAPVAARPGDCVIVQVFIHGPEQVEEAGKEARRSDSEADLRGAATLDLAVKRGQVVRITLEAPELSIDEPVQRVMWRGKPCRRSFLVDLPTGSDRHGHALRVRVDVGETPIGSIRFSIKLDRNNRSPNYATEPRGDSARRYERAFLSHAHDDAADVLKIAQAFQAAGIEFFHDIVSLRAGSEWQKRLFEEIERCDLFLLFWTENAARSKWVRRETEYAVDYKKKSLENLPDIVPILLDSVPPAKPAWLEHIHLDHIFRLAMLGMASQRDVAAPQAGGRKVDRS